MPVSRLKFESLPHAIFLQRVSGPESATTLEARLGQGAFLALRLVDLLAPDRGPVSQNAFEDAGTCRTRRLAFDAPWPTLAPGGNRTSRRGQNMGSAWCCARWDSRQRRSLILGGPSNCTRTRRRSSALLTTSGSCS